MTSSDRVFDLRSIREALGEVGTGLSLDNPICVPGDFESKEESGGFEEVLCDLSKGLQSRLNKGMNKVVLAAFEALTWQERDYHSFVRGVLATLLDFLLETPADCEAVSEKNMLEIVCRACNVDAKIATAVLGQEVYKRPDITLIDTTARTIVFLELKYVPVSYLRFPKANSTGHHFSVPYILESEWKMKPLPRCNDFQKELLIANSECSLRGVPRASSPTTNGHKMAPLVDQKYEEVFEEAFPKIVGGIFCEASLENTLHNGEKCKLIEIVNRANRQALNYAEVFLSGTSKLKLLKNEGASGWKVYSWAVVGAWRENLACCPVLVNK